MNIKYEIPPGTQLDLFEEIKRINPSNNVFQTAVQKQWDIKYTFENGQPTWGGGHGGEE